MCGKFSDIEEWLRPNRKAKHEHTYIKDMIGAAEHIIIKIIVWRDGTLSLDTF